MPSRTRGLPLLATLTLLAGLTPAVLPGPKAVADTAVTQDQGTALPTLWEPRPPWWPLWQASPGYVLHGVAPQAEGETPVGAVIDLADGSTSGPYQRSSLSSGTGLAGSSYVIQRYDATAGRVTAVDATDIPTGEVTTTPVPDGYGILHADAAWTLARASSPNGWVLHVLRPDTDTVTTPAGTGSMASYLGGDAHTAFLKDGADVERVDVDTGTAVTLPRPAAGWNQVVVGPHRLFSRIESNGNEAITWTDWDGTELGTATVPVAGAAYGDGWLPFGDRLLYLPQIASGAYTQAAYPVDLAGAKLDQPLATDVVDAEPAGDGTVVLVRADHPAGSVSVATDDGTAPRFVTDLPRLPQRFAKLRLVGDVLRATADTVAVATASDGSGDWQPADVPYAESGGVTLVDRGQDGPDADHVFDVSWDGGSRQVSDRGPRLGHGGQLLGLTLSHAADTPTQVQDVRSGAELDRLPATDSYALDGTWVWSLTKTGVLTAHDTADPTQDFEIGTGLLSSEQQLLDVRGRFALVHDEDGTWVVDSHQVVAPWRPVVGNIALGDGFVAGVGWTAQASGPRLARLRVFDLTADHVEHDFGALQGGVNPKDVSISVDEADTPRVAYVDNYHQPRMVTLDWLGTPPVDAPDTIAPTQQSGPTGALLRSTSPRTVTWSWSWTDEGRPWSPASGLASFDVRFRAESTSRGSTAAWTRPAAWQGLTAPSVSRAVAPGDGACVSARAHDGAGNVSGWSDEACTFVDGAAPVPAPVRGARVSRDLHPVLDWGFHATDDDAVAAYDVQYRLARRGQASYGTWTTPGSLTSPFTLELKPGQDLCMRFRGHDLAGRTGAWSTPHCQAVPVDADAWYAPGDALTYVSKKVIGGIYLELGYPKAFASMRHQAGRAVVLDVLRGPGLGDADVFFAGRRLTRLHFAAATRREQLVVLRLPKRETGAVKIVQVGKRHVRFGALAMLR